MYMSRTSLMLWYRVVTLKSFPTRARIKTHQSGQQTRQTDLMDGESPGFAETKQLSVRVSLKEIARRFASPLTEEHAWAVLYQLTQRFMRQRENFERGCSLYRSNQNQSGRVMINLDSVLLSEDGEVDMKTMRKKPIWEGEIIN